MKGYAAQILEWDLLRKGMQKGLSTEGWRGQRTVEERRGKEEVLAERRRVEAPNWMDAWRGRVFSMRDQLNPEEGLPFFFSGLFPMLPQELLYCYYLLI